MHTPYMSANTYTTVRGSFAQSDAGKVSTSYIALYLPTDVSATLRSGLFVSKQKFLPKESDSMASLQAPGKSLPAQLTPTWYLSRPGSRQGTWSCSKSAI